MLACLFVVASVPLPTVYLNSAAGRFFAPTAQAKGPVRNFVTRLLGQSLPDGIVKTNGRIEATQVDVAAKYPGRLTDITVEEAQKKAAANPPGGL